MTAEQYKQRYKKEPPVAPANSDIVGLLDKQPSATITKTRGLGNLPEFAMGTAASVGRVGENILEPVAKGLSKITGKEIKAPSMYRDYKPETTASKVGLFAGEAAQFAGGGAGGSGAKFLTKLGGRVAGGVGIGTLQEGKVGERAITAGAVEAVLPVGGAAARVTGRLVGSLGAGLSGLSTRMLQDIRVNPQAAKEVARVIRESGGAKVMRENADKILQGISKVRQEARQAYGQAVQGLKLEDISPVAFRRNIQAVMDDIGAVVAKGKLSLRNVEFSESKNLAKAASLIKELSRVKLDGYSLRQLLKKIEDSGYKIATSDERLSFNAFLNDLGTGVRNAINESTNKLGEINKAYSKDLQLTEAMEGILGKVKFKNLKELNKIANNLEQLYNKKGLSPEIIDEFLTKIGVNPGEFRAGEATRQAFEKELPKNLEGLSVAEVTRAATSAIVPPEMVAKIAMKIGVAEQALKPVLDVVKPAARGAFIRLLLGETD